MSNKTEGKCPFCPRGCDLSAPHCGRGEEYAADMFSVLTEEETIQLAALLEKLSDHWIEMAPNKPHRGGRHLER